MDLQLAAGCRSIASLGMTIREAGHLPSGYESSLLRHAKVRCSHS